MPWLPVEQRVDCRGCTACCRNFKVKLVAGVDDPAAYDAEPDRDGFLALRRREDGSCVYLGPGGCGIYGRRPAVCRGFSCALWLRWLASLGDDEVGAMLGRGAVSPDVFRAGKERLLEARPSVGEKSPARPRKHWRKYVQN